jgi:hypothetical protein
MHFDCWVLCMWSLGVLQHVEWGANHEEYLVGPVTASTKGEPTRHAQMVYNACTKLSDVVIKHTKQHPPHRHASCAGQPQQSASHSEAQREDTHNNHCKGPTHTRQTLSPL